MMKAALLFLAICLVVENSLALKCWSSRAPVGINPEPKEVAESVAPSGYRCTVFMDFKLGFIKNDRCGVTFACCSTDYCNGPGSYILQEAWFDRLAKKIKGE